jgi:hypothetical protein
MLPCRRNLDMHTAPDAIPGPSYLQAKDTYLVNHLSATSSVLLKFLKRQPCRTPRTLQNDALIASFIGVLAKPLQKFCSVAMLPCRRNLDVHTSPDVIPGPSYPQAKDTYVVNHSSATSSVLLNFRRDSLVELLGPFKMMP